MGWFDDNHWAGEAYDFGMGYMALAGFSPEAGLSDIDDSELDSGSDNDLSDFSVDFPGIKRCKGHTKTGARCKVTSNSIHPAARTILLHGYCSQHLPKQVRGHVASSREQEVSLIVAAEKGDVQAVRSLLPQKLDNDISSSDAKSSLKIDEVSATGDTALRAAVQKGHHHVVVELVCAGADPIEAPRLNVKTVLESVEQRLEEVTKTLRGHPPLASALALLQTKSQMISIQAVVKKACAWWPIPALPALPPEPPLLAISKLTVEQLKDVLRRHGAKLSGRKAELVDRVTAGDLLGLDRAKQLKEYEELRRDMICQRATIQQQLEERSDAIRKVGMDFAPRPPTQADFDAVDACDTCGRSLGIMPGTLPMCSCSARNHPGNYAFRPTRSNANLWKNHLMRGTGPLAQRSQTPTSDLVSLPKLGTTSGGRQRSRSPRRANVQKVCFHFLRGACHFGERCWLSHDMPSRLSFEAPRCCHFLQGKCRFGISCDFSHDRADGACQFGASCWFQHDA
eukprot:TRINITY_DN109597_c0_g1_i1.p1 TRINITY_DN109597_c0_g1~~TRINITY_DN109597_c0_g1_i1.p1  ORF type:complete len:511 (+),score=68.40 TRINITY_DN109597_c0_g1_i1:168-1700(+)